MGSDCSGKLARNWTGLVLNRGTCLLFGKNLVPMGKGYSVLCKGSMGGLVLTIKDLNLLVTKDLN